MAAVIVEQLKIKVKCITGEIKQKKRLHLTARACNCRWARACAYSKKKEAKTW
jgi:hypothetical protein